MICTNLPVGESIYYRGFNSQFSVFENKENHNYTWVTDDPDYALEYADGRFGKIAIVKLINSNIGSLWDLNEEDYLSPSDESMEELYSSGLCGFGFYANHEYSYCICANPTSFHVLYELCAKDFIALLSEK